MSEKPSIKVRTGHLLKEYWRVLRLTKKPGMDEFKTVVKVSALGMVVIGFIGFLIHMIKQVLF